jgi:putative heme transporter
MTPERPGTTEDEMAELDPRELSGLFATPAWLRGMGLTAWLLVGVTLLVVGAMWILSLTHTIVLPLITAGLVAAVAAPLARWLQNHHVQRGLGAVLLMVSMVALGAGVVLVVLAGITSQSGDISSHLTEAKNTLEGWLKDLGVDPKQASDANKAASSSASTTVSTLLEGVASGIKKLSSLFFFLALTALSLIFLLKDGPMIRAWGERHVGLPLPVARTITERVLQSLRGYFFGVTIVAAFNAVVVGLGRSCSHPAGRDDRGHHLLWCLRAVPRRVGRRSVRRADRARWSRHGRGGGNDRDTAVANGLLQQLVQPIAYGAALGIHPLAVLMVTIGGGALFGAAGLILAAPLTSAVTRIAADLARARASPTV